MEIKNIILQELGANIREIRESKDLSQENLAEISNLHRTYIGLIERGKKNPTAITLLRICSALEVPVSKLFEGIAYE